VVARWTQLRRHPELESRPGGSDDELARRAGQVLLASGTGLAGYGPDGSSRFRLFDGESIPDVQITGGLVYVGECDRRCFRIVDPASGRVLREARTKVPASLLGERP
jgi:hypothetical protein